jgi:hypothetical protein
MVVAANFVPSADETMKLQLVLGAFCSVQLVPKLVEVQIPLAYPPAANLFPFEEDASA